MLAADVHYALGRLIRGAEFARVPFADRLAKSGNARYRRVFGAIFVERLDGGALDVLRRGKVWFASAEIGDVNALGFELLGGRKHYHCGRRADAIYTISQPKDFFSFHGCGRFHFLSFSR